MSYAAGVGAAHVACGGEKWTVRVRATLPDDVAGRLAGWASGRGGVDAYIQGQLDGYFKPVDVPAGVAPPSSERDGPPEPKKKKKGKK